MSKQVWDTEDFRNWCARGGHSVASAAEILGVGKATVNRLKAGTTKPKKAIAMAAIAFEENSRTTKGPDGELIDSFAADSEFADLCSELPHAYVTSVTSAIARGWSVANLNGFRHVAQPVRMPQPAKAAGSDLNWLAVEDLAWGIECRRDADGNPYRIACVERTLIDLAADAEAEEETATDSFAAALSQNLVDKSLLDSKATERGQAVLDRVRRYMVQYS